MRLIALAALAALSGPALAQATHDCITTTCTIVSDAIAGTPEGVPAQCRLYGGATMLAEAPVVAPYACSFVRNFASGPWSLTARYVNATGEGAASNVLAFTSAVPMPAPPAPTGLRKL